MNVLRAVCEISKLCMRINGILRDWFNIKQRIKKMMSPYLFMDKLIKNSGNVGAIWMEI